MPDAKMILFGAGLVLACFVLAALVKSRRRAGPMLVQQSQALPHMKGSLDADARGRGVSVSVGREILEMLEAGRRAEAVALVRERTGWSQQEADAALTKLEGLKKRLES